VGGGAVGADGAGGGPADAGAATGGAVAGGGAALAGGGVDGAAGAATVAIGAATGAGTTGIGVGANCAGRSVISTVCTECGQPLRSGTVIEAVSGTRPGIVALSTCVPSESWA
jgi:hypothetical protein